MHSIHHRWEAPAASIQPHRSQPPAISCRYSSRDWGPYSVPGGSSSNSAQRLFIQALQQPLGDLCLDFNKCYINSRRGSSTLMDSSSSDTDSDMPAVSDITAEQDAAMCDALLRFQMLVSGNDYKTQVCSAKLHSQFLECVDLLSCHAHADSHTSHLQLLEGEVMRLAILARSELPARELRSMQSTGSSTSIDSSELQEHDAASRCSCQGQQGTAGRTDSMCSCNACPDMVDMLTATTQVRAINKAMFGHHACNAYSGNAADFYSPESNLLHLVVQNKAGSPAALAALYWEVGRRVGLPLEVVLLPGHTFLRPRVWGGCSWLIDPFNGGQVCNQGVVEARLNTCWGLQAPCISVDMHAIQPSASNGAAELGADASSRADRQQQQQLQSHSRLDLSHRTPTMQHTLSDAADELTGSQQQQGAHENLHQVHTAQVDNDLCSNSASSCSTSAAPLQPPDRQPPTPWGLGPHATPGCLLLRLLSNLRESYFCPLPASGFLRWGSASACASPAGKAVVWKALWTTRFARAMTPAAHHLIRDEGYALMQLGAQKEGMQLLRQYLASQPQAPDVSRVKEFIIPV